MEEKKTPLTYRILIWFIRLFSPKYEYEGLENIPEGPGVIVGNHCQMYGPIAAEFYVPGPHYTWCEAEMMEKDEVQAYAFSDFWSKKPLYIRWSYWLLSYAIVPLAVLLFNNAHTIGVRHDVRVISTFKESVKRLTEGCRVVIFPEDYGLCNNIIYHFRDRFIDVARMYSRRTGEKLPFIPLYISPRLRKMVYGKPVYFDPQAPIEEERQRVISYLSRSVTELAASLPEHTVVPYPNIPKRDYPKSLPVRYYSEETQSHVQDTR